MLAFSIVASREFAVVSASGVVESKGRSPFCVGRVSVMLVAAGPYAMKWASLRWTLVAGAFGALGVLCFFYAIERLPASRVVPMTAAYPALTVLLSWLLLHEKLTPRHLAGIAFALVGVSLLA